MNEYSEYNNFNDIKISSSDGLIKQEEVAYHICYKLFAYNSDENIESNVDKRIKEWCDEIYYFNEVKIDLLLLF